MEKEFVKPFRLGRKQKRAILDANGIEVCIFPHGQERHAEITCNLYNEDLGYYEHIIDLFDYGQSYRKHDIIRVIRDAFNLHHQNVKKI